eukprot:COSAG01_NODE_5495_length_4226_cov_3.635328_1_plen_584_part_00
MAANVRRHGPGLTCKEHLGEQVRPSMTSASATSGGQLLEDVNDPIVGRTLRVTSSVEPGTLLIEEPPLLTVPALRLIEPSELRKLYRNGARKLACGITPFLNLNAFVNADEETQRHVLEHFCSYELAIKELPGAEPDAGCESAAPATSTTGHPPVIATALRVSDWCRAHVECCQRFSREVLTRAQCAFAFNAHSMAAYLPPRPEELREHALFLRGSRLTHSCHPNTIFHVSPNGCAQHRAVVHIPAGEILTTCYASLRTGSVSHYPLSHRQRHLKQAYLFQCACDRCRGQDVTRRLPCPKCNARAASPTEVLSDSDFGAGPASSSSSLADASACTACVIRDGSAQGQRWRCQGCGGRWSDHDMDVEVSVDSAACVAPGIEKAFWQRHRPVRSTLFQWEHFAGALANAVTRNSTFDLGTLRRTMLFVARIVGTQHSYFVQLQERRLDLLFDELETDAALQNMESAAQNPMDLEKTAAHCDTLQHRREACCRQLWFDFEALWNWFEACRISSVWPAVEDLLVALSVTRQLHEYIVSRVDRHAHMCHIVGTTAKRLAIETGENSAAAQEFKALCHRAGIVNSNGKR